MRLSLFFDHRFHRDSEGRIFSLTSYNYDLIAKRYLSVFDEVTIIARVASDEPLESAGQTVEGPGVSVSSVGNWSGPIQFIASRAGVRRVVAEELQRGDSAIILVAPGVTGQAVRKVIESDRPYGVEVVGDPFDVFAPGASRHPLRPLLQAIATRELREQCRNASTAAYVSTTHLPNRYPAPRALIATEYSSIELRDTHFVTGPRTDFDTSREIQIVTTGSLAAPYKGVDVLLRAVAKANSSGQSLRLNVIGEGRYRQELEQLALNLGIGDEVRFLGRLPAGEAVRDELDRADIFVLASRTEGLPRAMIEAMARGLPCIGTDVGGIPELIFVEDLVPSEEPDALACKIKEVVSDGQRMAVMSSRNWRTAQNYRSEILQERRNTHYRALKDITGQWQNRNLA